jgi:hypothetical protein
MKIDGINKLISGLGAAHVKRNDQVRISAGFART